MLAVFFIAVGLAALYAVWRVRFGYPPDDLPRVLCYHKVSRSFCFEGTWTTPGRLEVTIDRLLGAGYRFLSEAEYLDALTAPAASHRQSLFLTFDDAYENVYEEAFPLLSKRDLPFHLFVVSELSQEEVDAFGGQVVEQTIGIAAHRSSSSHSGCMARICSLSFLRAVWQ